MRLLEAFAFDTLAHPWALLVLPAILMVLVAELSARAPGAVTVSTGETLLRVRRRGGEAMLRLPAMLRAAGLGMLAVALAGPLNGFQVREDRANVIDVMLSVDCSGSMSQPDFTLNGQPSDRLTATKLAVRDFIDSRRNETGSRYGLDRLGLVCYAGFAWTQCPLTLDYDVLLRELDRTQIADERRKNGTAIGSAIGLSVQRLSKSEAKSKVIILLTDGRNNCGELDPITAAGVAKQYNIRVYTIGVGATEVNPLAGGFFGPAPEPIDEDMLQRIAQETGAKYYRVTDSDALVKAYEEISKLETTEIEVGDYYEYKDAFLPYLLLGSALLLGGLFAKRIWFETIP